MSRHQEIKHHILSFGFFGFDDAQWNFRRDFLNSTQYYSANKIETQKHRVVHILLLKIFSM